MKRKVEKGQRTLKSNTKLPQSKLNPNNPPKITFYQKVKNIVKKPKQKSKQQTIQYSIKQSPLFKQLQSKIILAQSNHKQQISLLQQIQKCKNQSISQLHIRISKHQKQIQQLQKSLILKNQELFRQQQYNNYLKGIEQQQEQQQEEQKLEIQNNGYSNLLNIGNLNISGLNKNAYELSFT